MQKHWKGVSSEHHAMRIKHGWTEIIERKKHEFKHLQTSNTAMIYGVKTV